ncbi:hypothetical protein B4099_2309 [Heyndrickxia coagulans]|uniref:Uncharacterized protein n=1 Tax=Heyndrickxia coagulans TaxID=1398 RepID=A0A150KJ43_HEYCO|nr:hypothetical protein B4099_2309 [Heyndrickxia coagulans]
MPGKKPGAEFKKYKQAGGVPGRPFQSVTDAAHPLHKTNQPYLRSRRPVPAFLQCC